MASRRVFGEMNFQVMVSHAFDIYTENFAVGNIRKYAFCMVRIHPIEVTLQMLLMVLLITKKIALLTNEGFNN